MSLTISALDGNRITGFKIVVNWSIVSWTYVWHDWLLIWNNTLNDVNVKSSFTFIIESSILFLLEKWLLLVLSLAISSVNVFNKVILSTLVKILNFWPLLITSARSYVLNSSYVLTWTALSSKYFSCIFDVDNSNNKFAASKVSESLAFTGEIAVSLKSYRTQMKSSFTLQFFVILTVS